MKLVLAAFAAGLLCIADVRAQTEPVSPRTTAVPAAPQQDSQPPEAAEALALSQTVVQLYEQGKHDEAIPLARRAVQLAEKAYGPDARFTSGMLANLAMLHVNKKQLDDALPLYERVLTIREKSVGPSQPSEVTALETYNCVLAIKTAGRADKKRRSLFERIHYVFREDSIIAQGFAAPFKDGEITGGKAISKPAPDYPERAKYNRVGGSVVMRLEVDETGKVTSVRALDCTPQILRAPAEEAVRKATFEPTIVRGKPVKTSGFITYHFFIAL